MVSHLAVQVQDTWIGWYPVLILNADPHRTCWKSCRWAGQTPEFWMRKVTPTGLQAACCAGTQLGTNTSELAACGNAVPATAPHRCSCACANTRLYSIPSVTIFGCWPISTCHSLQPGISEGGQEQQGDWWHRHTIASPREGKPALPRAGLAPHCCRRALQSPPPVRATCPPWMYGTSVGAVRDIRRCRVVCGLWLQAGTEMGSVFCSCSCTCGWVSSGLGEPPAQSSPQVCKAHWWVCFSTTNWVLLQMTPIKWDTLLQ